MKLDFGVFYDTDNFGDLLDESDSARWLWFGRAALRGFPVSFLAAFQVEEFFFGSGNASDWLFTEMKYRL